MNVRAMGEVPTQIGRYRVMRILGGGAMGVVYEAHDSVIDRKVAIKLVHARLLDGDERQDYIERFQREAQAVGRCNHPAIVAIFDFALHDQNPYLVMEFVDGIGLDSALAQGHGFTLDSAIHVILRVLEALGCAHAAGIVHRDIKPGNVLLLAGGRVKVADFGIARLDSSHLTLDGMAVGTPRYMSPEQCLGGTVDHRSDLFSVAVLLQEMLTGERPFAGQTLAEIACNLLRDPPAGSDRVTEVAGAAVNSVIQRALAKVPTDRYASAEAMAKALQEAMGVAQAESSAVHAIDQTVVAVRGQVSAPHASGSATLDPLLLSDIERKLADRVGPIARFLVQTSLPGAASAEALCDVLARKIDRQEDRRKFLAEALDVVSGSHATTQTSDSSAARFASAGLIPLNESERARRALAETLGPIAKILVRKALSRATSSQALWDLLAAHIDSPEDRARFLRQRDKPPTGPQ